MMKLLGLILVLILCLSLLTGCDNSSEAVLFNGFSEDDELVGIWMYDFTHLGEVLIFNDDGTGVDYRLFTRPPSYRPFVWTRENGYLVIEGGFNGKFSYTISESILILFWQEHDRSNMPFYCVYSAYSHRCCCMRIARNYFFDITDFDNVRHTEPNSKNEYEIDIREDNTTMEKAIDFNLENTIRVLNDVLIDADVNAESGIVQVL